MIISAYRSQLSIDDELPVGERVGSPAIGVGRNDDIILGERLERGLPNVMIVNYV